MFKNSVLSLIVLISSFAQAQGILITCGPKGDMDPHAADVTFVSPVLVPEQVPGVETALLIQGYPHSRIARVTTIGNPAGGLSGYIVFEKLSPGYLGSPGRAFVFSEMRACNTPQSSVKLQVMTVNKGKMAPISQPVFCGCKVGAISLKNAE